MTNTESNNEMYFAARPSEEITPYLYTRVKNYHDYLKASGLFDQLEKSYFNYYGLSRDKKFSAHKIKRNKLYSLKVNHYRNMAQHLLSMLTQQRPNFEALALNTDYKSMSQTRLGKQLVNTYFREKDGETEAINALEYTLFLGSAEVEVSWNEGGGKEYWGGIDQGDVAIDTYSPIDVIQEKRVKPQKRKWVILRKLENKWDLAAKYKSKSEAIIKAKLDPSDLTFKILGSIGNDDPDDYIYTYKFYHAKTPALPKGREVLFLDKNTLLKDFGELRYKRIPVFPIQGAPIHGTNHGYAQNFDILGLTELYDKLNSLILSNQMNYGLPHLITGNQGVEVERLDNGMPILKADDPSQVKQLDLLSSPKELFDTLNLSEQNMEKLMGLSSVQRGDPSANLKSGNALALVASQSIQFISVLANSYNKLLENMGSGIVECLQIFATTERVENIAGTQSQVYAKSFKNADIDKISRVIVQVGSPLLRTLAGRVEIAQNLLNKGLIKTVDQYFACLETGRVEPIYEGEVSELMLIRAENEKLKEGIPQPVLATDKPDVHIKEHLSVLANPDARTDPNVIKAVSEHVQQHINEWKMADPNILAMMGVQPYQQAQPLPNMPTGSEAAAPADIAQNPAAAMPIKQAEDIEQLKQRMPKNPLSGQPYNPETGGL